MSQLETIYVDECGYTGPDLMHSQQPVFALAALRFEELEAEDIKRKFFSRVRADELKYRDMSKIPIHRDAILKFLEYLGPQADRFRVLYIHKPFAVTCKIVDLLVETSMDRHGFDLYEHGGNIAMANMLHLGVCQIAGASYGTALLLAFQKMVRQPSGATMQGFWDILNAETVPSELDRVLDLVRGAMFDLGPHFISRFDDSYLDVVMPPTIALMSQWGRHLSGRMALTHDESSHLASHKELWDAMTSPTAPPAFVGYDRRTITFPIGVKCTYIRKSVECAGLQLADVVAGAIAHTCRTYMPERVAPLTDYEIRLREVVGPWRTKDHMWPAAEFTPEALGTTGPKVGDAIEYMGDRYNDVET